MSNIFIPSTRIIGRMPNYTPEEMKQENMIFNGDREFSYYQSGKITRRFIENFLDEDKDWIIDTRVHMLMKDWYPCIGGWHCDDIPRDEITKQPNYKDPDYISEHILCVIDSGTGSLTEFVDGRLELSNVPNDKQVYEHFNKEINELVDDNKLNTQQFKSGDVLSFNSMTFHQGQPAVNKGFRMFIRATTNTQRKPRNEIRKQTNVYLDTNKGW